MIISTTEATKKNPEQEKLDEEEVQNLHKNKTWGLIQLPNKKKKIRCKWKFTNKNGDLKEKTFLSQPKRF